MSGAIVKTDTETVVASSPSGNVVTVQDALSNWDISNDELKEFTDKNGIYSTILRSLSDVVGDDFMAATDLVLDSKKYLTPKDARFFFRSAPDQSRREIVMLLDEYKRCVNYSLMLKFIEAQADEEKADEEKADEEKADEEDADEEDADKQDPFDELFNKMFDDAPGWTNSDGAKRDLIRKVNDLIRDTYGNEGLPRLLEKLRELLAVSKANSKAETDSDSGFEDEAEAKPKDSVASVLGRSPFGNLNETITSLIKCVRLFLIHVRNNDSRLWKLKLGPEEKSSEAQDGEKLSDWVVLDRFLKQDIEKNGPAPEELQLLFRSAHVAVKLEGFTPEQLSALEQSDDEAVADTLACIKEARAYFGIR